MHFNFNIRASGFIWNNGSVIPISFFEKMSNVIRCSGPSAILGRTLDRFLREILKYFTKPVDVLGLPE